MDKISRIFDSFTQADKSIATEYGGTGLGLVIFKRLVELQEGNISVTSETGVSSEFRFTCHLKSMFMLTVCQCPTEHTAI